MVYFNWLFSLLLAVLSVVFGAAELLTYFQISEPQLYNPIFLGLTLLMFWVVYYFAIKLSIIVALRRLYFDVFDRYPNYWIDVKELIVKELDKSRKVYQKETDLLKEKDQFRKEYIGNISHELKTPLHTIQGFTDILLDDGMEDDILSRKYLGRIASATERLISVVSDLDTISKIESGQIEISPVLFNLIPVIDKILGMLEIKAKEHYITFKWEKSSQVSVVYADPERIEQVLINLITNSILHSGDGKTVTIQIKTPPLSNHTKIVIEDNGEGISLDHQKRIFERFFRIDPSRNRYKGGSGLGLSIVKHLIEAHKQCITVESVPKRFTRFQFTLYNKVME